MLGDLLSVRTSRETVRLMLAVVGRMGEIMTAFGKCAAKVRLNSRINKHVWTSGVSPKMAV
jgi:hypothetical protein